MCLHSQEKPTLLRERRDTSTITSLIDFEPQENLCQSYETDTSGDSASSSSHRKRNVQTRYYYRFEGDHDRAPLIIHSVRIKSFRSYKTADLFYGIACTPVLTRFVCMCMCVYDADKCAQLLLGAHSRKRSTARGKVKRLSKT